MLEAIKSYLPSFISHYLSTEFELFLRQELAEKFKYNDVPEQWITFLNRIDQMLVSLDSPLCDLAGQLLLCDEAKLKEKMISYIRSERVYDPVNSEILYRPMAYYFSEESAKLLAEQIMTFHQQKHQTPIRSVPTRDYKEFSQLNQEEKEFVLHFADLKGVHFEQIDLKGLNLKWVNFNQTSLSKVDFTASRLPSIDHFQQDIRGCIWQGASFEALIDTTPENINRIKQKLANMESIEANDFMQSVKQALFANLIKKIKSQASSLSYYGIRKLTDLNTIFNTQVGQPLCQLNGQSLFLDENRFKSSTVAALLPNEIWNWNVKLNNNYKYEANGASDIILKYHQLQSAIALPHQNGKILDFNSLPHESKENILLYAKLNGANLEGISCQNMDLRSSASFKGALLYNTDFSNTKLPSFDNFLDMEPQRLASCVWRDASCQKPTDPKLEDIEKILNLLQEVNSKDFTKMILNSLIHHGEGNILKRLLYSLIEHYDGEINEIENEIERAVCLKARALLQNQDPLLYCANLEIQGILTPTDRHPHRWFENDPLFCCPNPEIQRILSPTDRHLDKLFENFSKKNKNFCDMEQNTDITVDDLYSRSVQFMNKHGQPIYGYNEILQGMQSENFIKNYKKYFQVFLALLENESIPLSMQKRAARDLNLLLNEYGKTGYISGYGKVVDVKNVFILQAIANLLPYPKSALLMLSLPKKYDPQLNLDTYRMNRMGTMGRIEKIITSDYELLKIDISYYLQERHPERQYSYPENTMGIIIDKTDKQVKSMIDSFERTWGSAEALFIPLNRKEDNNLFKFRDKIPDSYLIDQTNKLTEIIR